MPAPKKDPTDGLDALRRKNTTVSSRLPLSGSRKWNTDTITAKCGSTGTPKLIMTSHGIGDMHGHYK